ncbi:MAG: amidase family protein [Pseudomonadota bacterium]
MSDSWLWLSAADLGRGIARGEIDPIALTETYLAAIDAHPARDTIYARTTGARARAEAAAAARRARLGTRRGPLDGVPISWKDLFDSAGTATEAGSRLLAGRVPQGDAVVLANATRAGLVCLGKTHMSELAFSGLGINPMAATSPNVHEAGRAPGGSSSGAAASVAFGLAAAGIGSDTGGSVRIPSAWNGLVGLKTTPGLLSLNGVVPLAPQFDTVGPLCRSVEDAALLLTALGGGPAVDLHQPTIAGRHFLVAEDLLAEAEPTILAAFEDTCARLRDAGALISAAAMPEIAAALAAAGPTVTGETYGVWHTAIEAAPDQMFARIRDRFRLGAEVSATAYVGGQRVLAEAARGMEARLTGVSAILAPTTPNLPPEIAVVEADADRFVAENLLALRNTRIANLLGLASLTVPTPTRWAGFMLIGGAGAEARLLCLGAAIEPLMVA